MYTKDLRNYKSYPPTSKCYLDGRYFNKVFEKYPGLITSPLEINIYKDKNEKGMRYKNTMNVSKINNAYPGLLRVVIKTPESRHSNLVIIDYKGQKIFRYEPEGINSPYFSEINQIIENYLDMYIDFDMYVINEPAAIMSNPKCENRNIKSGFCSAYIIKYAYDYLNGLKYDSSEILRFATAVESIYGPLNGGNEDIEYGLGDGINTRNVGIGALGGAALGGLMTGGAGGILAGGLAGGAIGGLL